MVNNTAKIGTMLSFVDKDDFYFVQIFKRRKDNPDLDRDQIVIDNFYIDSMEDYIKKVPHIINVCDAENARAYLRVNKRNYKKLAQHMLKRVVNIVFTENCKALRNSFDSVAGEFHADPDKKWIVDIDWIEFDKIDNISREFLLSELLSFLETLQLEAEREPMLEILPTKNGVHIITRPFSLLTFRGKFPKIDVHKDNPTILYCP